MQVFKDYSRDNELPDTDMIYGQNENLAYGSFLAKVPKASD
jgi:hypothetical protein